MIRIYSRWPKVCGYAQRIKLILFTKRNLCRECATLVTVVVIDKRMNCYACRGALWLCSEHGSMLEKHSHTRHYAHRQMLTRDDDEVIAGNTST